LTLAFPPSETAYLMGEHHELIPSDILEKQMIVRAADKNGFPASAGSAALTMPFGIAVFLGLRPHISSQPDHHKSINTFAVQARFCYAGNAYSILDLDRIRRGMGNMDVR
jgi:hypothetical protein